MIDAPHGLTLFTTANPQPDRRRTVKRPTLTVARGPRDTGRAPSSSEHSGSAVQVWKGGPGHRGQAMFYLAPSDADGRPITSEVLAEVQLFGVGILGVASAIAALADIKRVIDATRYEPWP